MLDDDILVTAGRSMVKRAVSRQPHPTCNGKLAQKAQAYRSLLCIGTRYWHTTRLARIAVPRHAVGFQRRSGPTSSIAGLHTMAEPSPDGLYGMPRSAFEALTSMYAENLAEKCVESAPIVLGPSPDTWGALQTQASGSIRGHGGGSNAAFCDPLGWRCLFNVHQGVAQAV